MTDPFDKLIEETREKYRVSWEKSLEKYKRSCEWQDSDFEWAIKHGYFIPRIAIEQIIVEAKPRTLRAEYGLDFVGTPHRASIDALNTLRFFFHLLKRQKTFETTMETMRSMK